MDFICLKLTKNYEQIQRMNERTKKNTKNQKIEE